MSLEKISEYGKIKVNDNIFAKVVLNAVSRTGGKVFCASQRGKILGGIDQKVSTGELVSNIKISDIEGESGYLLEFSVVMAFGASIKQNCVKILDFIEKEMRTMFPNKSGKIVLKIIGVKSKKMAIRNIQIVREYEP